MNIILQNTENNLPGNAATEPKRLDSSTIPMWKPQTCELGVIDHFVHFSILHAAFSQQGDRFKTKFSINNLGPQPSLLDLRSSGILRSVDWQFVNVLGQPTSPIFMGQEV